MAQLAPQGFDSTRLRSLVQHTYQQVALSPYADYHFNRGLDYAVDLLGYDPQEASFIPRVSADRFAGVGNPHRVGPIREGEVVLDHACGGGFDLLLAARRVGPTGRAIGVDLTPGMRQAAEAGARFAGLDDIVDVRAGVFEELPVESNSVDVVLSNGVLNLAPNKPRVLAEIARVLKPGGRLHLADVVVRRELTMKVRQSPELWAACIAGALPEFDVIPLLREAGFSTTRLVERFDCFRGTSAEAKVSKDLTVRGATYLAVL
jgi:SAM-dependent methyltransferase